MRRNEILRDIEKGKEEGKEFIRWWRKENDFVDYELVDHFIKSADAFHEMENFELLDMEQMWQVLKKWKPTGLRHSKSTRSDMIVWDHTDRNGEKHTYTCPYNAHSLMSIFNAETRGNTLV